MTQGDEEKEYGRTEDSVFVAKGTIGVPHYYVITERLVVFTSDNHSGMLGKSAIEEAESRGIRCGQKGCQLSYKEHELAVLVHCYQEVTEDRKKVLQSFLESLIPVIKLDDLENFVLVDHFSNSKEGRCK